MEPKEWKTYATVRQLDNLEIPKARFYKHVYGRHYHDGYALGIILQGSETYDCNKKNNVAPKGSVVVVNPGDIHTGRALDSTKGWGYFMLYPHISLVRSALAQLELNDNRLPVFPESVILDREFAGELIRFMDVYEAGDTELGLESAFLRLMSLMIARHAEFPAIPGAGSDDTGKIRRVTEILHAQYAAPISLERLAREVNLSSWALLRLFKKQTGISPYLLQTRLRLTRAKEALRSGRSPADTAVLCGFSDQSHMTKQFKRWMGITPGDIQTRAAG